MQKRPVTQRRPATAVKCRSHGICVLSQSNLFRAFPTTLLHKFRRTFLELNYQKPFPKKKGKNRRRLFTSSVEGEVEYFGSVHTYLHIFESETFSFRVRLPSSCVRWIPAFLNPLSGVKVFEYVMNLQYYWVVWTLNPDIFFIRWCNKIEPSSLLSKAEKDENFKFGSGHDTQLKNTAKYTKYGAGKELAITHRASMIWKGLVKHRQILETLATSNILLHFFATVRSPLHDFNFRGVHLYSSELE